MKIGIIGAGNVATHLALAFQKLGYSIPFIFSRRLSNAEDLAKRLGALAINRLEEFPRQFDVLIIAIKDDAIEKVAKQIPEELTQGKFVFHTSGSIPSKVLNTHSNHGVFYPLQTFSKDKALDLSEVPFCIYGNNSDATKIGLDLAKKLSDSVYEIDDEQRAYLHIAAVFANNFVNHINGEALDICKEKNIPSALLFPLMKETLEKALSSNPFSVQTGPAIRGDEAVLQKQEGLLIESQSKLDLYQLLSSLIKKRMG